jgi:hypothetical protein
MCIYIYIYIYVAVLRFVASCIFLAVYQRFGGICCFILQGWNQKTTRCNNQRILTYFFLPAWYVTLHLQKFKRGAFHMRDAAASIRKLAPTYLENVACVRGKVWCNRMLAGYDQGRGRVLVYLKVLIQCTNGTISNRWNSIPGLLDILTWFVCKFTWGGAGEACWLHKGLANTVEWVQETSGCNSDHQYCSIWHVYCNYPRALCLMPYKRSLVGMPQPSVAETHLSDV